MENNIQEMLHNYYMDNIDELNKKYLNKHIIIKDNKVVGSYDSFGEAVKAATKKYELGTFIVKYCSGNIDNQIAYFHSRAILN